MCNDIKYLTLRSLQVVANHDELPNIAKKNTDILAIYFRTNPGSQGESNKQLERCLTFSSRRKTEK